MSSTLSATLRQQQHTHTEMLSNIYARLNSIYSITWVSNIIQGSIRSIHGVWHTQHTLSMDWHINILYADPLNCSDSPVTQQRFPSSEFYKTSQDTRPGCRAEHTSETHHTEPIRGVLCHSRRCYWFIANTDEFLAPVWCHDAITLTGVESDDTCAVSHLLETWLMTCKLTAVSEMCLI